MRIVAAPPLPKAWREEMTCSHCRAVLEVELTDLQYHESPPMRLQSDPLQGEPYYSFTCLCCNRDTNFWMPSRVKALWLAQQAQQAQQSKS